MLLVNSVQPAAGRAPLGSDEADMEGDAVMLGELPAGAGCKRMKVVRFFRC